MFGAVVSLMFVTPVEGPWILFALLALTVLRMLPVYLAFLGSSVPLREQTVLGLAAPRGLFGTRITRALIGKVQA